MTKTASTLVPKLDALADRCVEATRRAPVVSKVVDGTATLDDLRLFAARTEAYVRETFPSLERAAERLAATGRDPDLHAFFRRKCEEERGHDAWIAGDLAACGDAASAGPPPGPGQAVRGYIEMNRALIESITPVAYLGAAYVLERLAADLAAGAVERLTRSGAASPDALIFLQGHADADPHHVGELAEVLSRIEDPAVIDAVLCSAHCTAILYPAFFSAPA